MRLGFTIAAALAAVVACQGSVSLAPESPPEFKALDWVSDGADPVDHLTLQPAACLVAPDDAAVQRGELLFNSPLLLGGQAAKAGLSCAACHRNGRSNPDFVFSGISGVPGTADVTSGLFSKLRADRVFNPVPIPDLATEAGQRLVNRYADGELEAFLSAQIIEEFSGVAPNGSVIEDLATYIRSLDAATCDATAEQAQTWKDEMGRLRAGAAYLRTKPVRDASAYRLAMRAALGRLYERYPASHFEDLSQDLVSLGRDLGQADVLVTLDARLSAIEQSLRIGESQSLYNPEQLARALP